MNIAAGEKTRQRADYTYKYNAKMGRHGWLRLTPAYSVKVVEELLDLYPQPQRILDPFCGTATTALSAAYCGHEGVTIDINPFLVWLGRLKTAKYSAEEVALTHGAGVRVIAAVKQDDIEPAQAPDIHNIERWWCSGALKFLCALKACIESESSENSVERNLLMVAFCRTLMGLSNASFSHQSLSFNDDKQLHGLFDDDMSRVFMENVYFVLEGAEENPRGTAHVVFGDARNLAQAIDAPFDLVITSPPYANRMSYIRELRPYMYWLGYLNNAHDAGELDWSAIGGTWGVATSRLTGWDRSTVTFSCPVLESALMKIQHCGHRNGKVLANYVAKYFEDLWKHFNALLPMLNKNSEVHYIVGNSTFYGVLLSVEQYYATMLSRLGFENIKCNAIRKRNSKRELYEFDVSARWNG